MPKPDRQKAGGQLNRSQTVTVRLDPKLNYLTELAARAHRRTKSSMIEAALVDALTKIPLDHRLPAGESQSIASSAEFLWDVDEVGRLQRLVILAPHLMTYEEQKIWSVIERNSYFWQGEWEPSANYKTAVFKPDISPGNLMLDRVATHWETITAIADGKADQSHLPEPILFVPWNDDLFEVTMTLLMEKAHQATGVLDG